MNPFGENLRKIRNEKNMSQDDFATLLGTSKQVISRYETNQRSPKVSTVAEYAEKLGVSISTLTDDPIDRIRASLGSDSPAAQKLRDVGEQLKLPDLGTLFPDEPDVVELVDIFHDLNSLGRQALMGTARGLAANPDMKKDGASNDVTA